MHPGSGILRLIRDGYGNRFKPIREAGAPHVALAQVAGERGIGARSDWDVGLRVLQLPPEQPVRRMQLAPVYTDTAYRPYFCKQRCDNYL
ncbi:MAG: hypothetical protein GF331_00160 [Chitinivibrionales bacterium]|nr:hypothetical protein [Chitinivibrionales bacterium]